MMREQSPKEYSCAAIRSTKHCGDGRSSSCCLNDDLLIEILSRLPQKSLHRFTSVSKSWRSLISNTFRLRPLGPMSGLLYHTNSRSDPWDEKKGYIDLSDACSSNCRDAIEPWSSNKNCMEVIDQSWSAFLPTSDVNLTRVHIYCNGLFLLYCESIFQVLVRYHICNPATNQCFALPEPPLDPNLRHFIPLSTLAFDPSLSPHYKVVLFSKNPLSEENPIYVDIFSSKERRWIDRKEFPETFSLSNLRHYDSVFLNGALHFIIQPNSVYRIDVEELSGRTIKLPNSPSTVDIDELCHESNLNGRCIRMEEGKRYFMSKCIEKCQGHLFYIRSALDLSEMEIWMLQNFETGEWLLKHIIRSENIEKLVNPHDGFPPCPIAFRPDKEVLFMVFQGRILSYHFGSNMSDNDRWEEVCTFGIDQCLTLVVPYTRCPSFLNPPLTLS